MEPEFIDLIKQLLACNNQEEVNQVLNTNKKLIVPGLLPVIAQKAENLADNSNSDGANFLFNLTLQLGEFLGSCQMPSAKRQETADALFDIGIRWHQISLFSLALQCFQQVLAIYREVKNRRGEAGALQNLGLAYGSLGQYQEAIKLYEQVSEITQELKDHQGEAGALQNLGAAYSSLGEYQRAIDFHQKCLAIAQKIKYRQGEANALGGLGNAYYFLGQYQRAIKLHHKNLKIARKIKDRRGEAISLGNLGAAYGYLGKYEKAIKCIKQNLDIVRDIGDRRGEANALGSLGVVYTSQGKYEEAIELQKQSLAIAQDIGYRQGEATALKNWAGACHSLGEYQRTIEFQEKSLAIARKIKDRKGEGSSLGNLGATCFSLGQYEDAFDCYQQSLGIAREIEDCRGEAIALGNLGLAYGSLGQYDRALDFHQKSLKIAKKIKDRQQEANSLGHLGGAYGSLEEYEDAIESHQKSLEIAQEIKDRQGEATALGNLGAAYGSLGKYKRTINFQQQSLEIAKEIKYRQGEANALGNLGVAYRSLGKYKKAIKFLKQYLEIVREIKARKGEANALGNLGVAYGSLGQYDRAIAYFQESINIATSKTMPVECARHASNLGDLEFTQGNWENAIAAYTQAIEATEILRTGRQTDNSRQEILKNAIGVYANIIQCFVNTGQHAEALTYAEQSRNRQLVDLMYSKDVYYRGETPPEVVELLQQYEGIKRQLDNLRFNNESPNNRETVGAANPRQIRASWQARNDRIIALEADKQEIYRQIRKLDRVLAEGLAVKPLEFPQLQNLLRNSATTAIVSFFSINEDTYAFILTGDRVDLHRCGQGYELQTWLFEKWLQPYAWSGLSDSDRPSPAIMAAAKLLGCDVEAIASAKPETDTVAIFLKDGSRQSADKAEFNKLRKQLAYIYDWHQQMPSNLKEISQRLQLDKLLEKLTGIEELIVVPHLFLHQIPFAALPLADNQNLGDKFLIRTQSSCQTLDFCTQRDPVSTQQTAFGIVEDTQEDLPCSSFEAQQVAQIYSVAPDKYLQGTAATVGTYKQLLQQVQGVLSSHHAISRLDNSLESALILADGAITLSDLLSPALRFPNLDEIFLSCCETNLGTTEITDDTMTLNTGFLCAGARGAISSLWAVDDLATSLFSLYYHRERKAGKNRPQALQKAQQDLRQLTGQEFAAEYYGDLERMLDEKLQLTSQKKAEAKQKLDACAEDAPEYPELKLEYEKRERLSKRISATKDKRLKAVCQQEHPFQHPEDWSGFICAGLR